MELEWWIQEAGTHKQSPVISPVPDLITETSASLVGWCFRIKGARQGAMVNKRETNAHRCTGTSGSVSYTENLCQEQVSCEYFDLDRQ